MPAFPALFAPLSVLLLLLTGMTPLGLSGDIRFLPPGLVHAAIHFWSVRDARSMPYWLIFLFGLAVDIVSYGPLGYWAVVYVTGIYVARWLPGPAEESHGAIRGWLGMAVVATITSVVAWLLASGYFMQAIPAAPFVKSTAALIILYPFLAWALSVVARATQERRALNLERRG